MTGRFVVFEGGDGVGKSTQVRLLADRLQATGIEHVLTRQPGGTELGATLRNVVLDPTITTMSSRTEALLYAADKAQHVAEVVNPALEAGKVVVSDRYVDSMIAYQGAGRDLVVDEIANLAHWATAGLVPDLTVVLDADPAQAVAKIATKDRLEGAGVEFHQRAREHLLALAAAAPERYLVLNAREPREAIADQVAERLWQLF